MLPISEEPRLSFHGTTSPSREYHSEHISIIPKVAEEASWPPCQEACHITTQEPGLTSCASRNSSSDVNEEAGRTTNDPPTTCDECANNGLMKPMAPFGRNRELSQNVNGNLNRTTTLLTLTTLAARIHRLSEVQRDQGLQSCVLLELLIGIQDGVSFCILEYVHLYSS